MTSAHRRNASNPRSLVGREFVTSMPAAETIFVAVDE